SGRNRYARVEPAGAVAARRRGELGQSSGAADSHTRKNLDLWERTSDEYEARHTGSLRGASGMAWGFWRIPESQVRFLGEIRGKRILELGCGAARWSIGLARHRARPIGMDFSAQHLQHAVTNRTRARLDFPLIRADAEHLPFRDGSVDIVFCDWGAMSFADPIRTVPEVARVLRPGGRFVFSTDSPIHFLCHDLRRDRSVRRLQRSYFGLHRLDFGEEVDFQLPYGEWIGLFRRNGLAIDGLYESRPGPTSKSSYKSVVETAWARRWPAESIWQLRREHGRAAKGTSTRLRSPRQAHRRAP
ncbi:MAG: class I SAM-dependent methyltransferase, partial [Thermoplasmata archaeon]|nr:class I SAM-dependent methyltransferase [Thermoplasmata archaeon]